MLNLEEYDKRWLLFDKRHQAELISNRTDCDLSEELSLFLKENGKVVTKIDARTFDCKQTLLSSIIGVPDGYLLIDHIMDIPDGDEAESVAAYLRVILKGDYINAGENTYFGNDCIDWLARHNIKVIGIMNQSNEKTPIFKKICPKAACGIQAYTNQGFDCYD